MEWGAISYVSSGLTLTAFITALIAWVVKGKSEEKERLISEASNKTKAQLVQDALEFFHVNTNNLTKQQQFKIAIEQIKNRAKKFKIIALLVGLLTIVAATLSAYAISEVNNTTKITPADPCDVPFNDKPTNCIFDGE